MTTNIVEIASALVTISETDRGMVMDTHGNESKQLIERQKKRLETINMFEEFMRKIGKPKGKGAKIRRELRCFLLVGAHKVFETEEDEYQYIGKYGRGAWDEDRLRQTFTDDEMLTIRIIGECFGALDY